MIGDPHDCAARTLLGRPADASIRSIGGDWVDIAERLLRSPEFALGEINRRLQLAGFVPGFGIRYAGLLNMEAHFAAYVPPLAPTPGFYTDFLGQKTRVHYTPGSTSFDGHVVCPPSLGQVVYFELAEWQGTLEAVHEAQARGQRNFTVVELGAGWAPWLVTASTACRLVGIHEIQLVGVEADDVHFDWMRQHLSDNGVDPDAHFLFRGAVGPEDGVLHFPVLPDPGSDWGARAVAADAVAERDYRGLQLKHRAVPCIGLGSLVERHDRIDLVHCDIQGGETEAIPAAADILTDRVRRMVIGTHSRTAEGAVVEALARRGWVLQIEQPCQFGVEKGREAVFMDGCQLWVNPKLA